jgi:CRISPR-associated protein Csd1
MILEELKRLAEREHLLADEGYAPQKVHAVIAITPDGDLLGIQPQMTAPASGKGKPQPSLVSLPAPEGRRTSGDATNFLYDKSDYVFGVGDADEAKLANRKRLFRDLIAQANDATDDEGMRAVSRFLDRLDKGEFAARLHLSEEPGAVYAFQDIDDPAAFISDREPVRAWWRERRAASGGDVATCVLCGTTAPVARTHPELKNVPGGNAAGVALVSFNAPAFTSFGFSDHESHRNAPFCRNCADSYTRALNRLLAPAWPDPRRPGVTLQPGNYRLSNDTVALFWSATAPVMGVFRRAMEGNPTAIAELFGSPWDGSLHEGRYDRFYSIILSGAQGRAVLRSSFDVTLPELVENLRRYFRDLELVPLYATDTAPLPLHILIRALQAPGVRSTVPPNIAQQLYEAAVTGRPYNPILLDAALRRLRAGEPFTRARIAIIKAVLNAQFRTDTHRQWKEITMALDPDNREIGYRLGRLFAVLERLQADAINSPNATIVDRYFGAASATPAVVFPRLMKLAQHHASKSTRGSWFQRQIQDVVEGLDPANAFPSTLPMNQQGLFAVGYYHQRADLFTSKG